MPRLKVRIRDPRTNVITTLPEVFADLETARVAARGVAPVGAGVEFANAETGEVELVAQMGESSWSIHWMKPPP